MSEPRDIIDDWDARGLCMAHYEVSPFVVGHCLRQFDHLGPHDGQPNLTSPCNPPTNHRYGRIGVTDMLRCRLCGFERPG